MIVVITYSCFEEKNKQTHSNVENWYRVPIKNVLLMRVIYRIQYGKNIHHN